MNAGLHFATRHKEKRVCRNDLEHGDTETQRFYFIDLQIYFLCVSVFYFPIMTQLLFYLSFITSKQMASCNARAARPDRAFCTITAKATQRPDWVCRYPARQLTPV